VLVKMVFLESVAMGLGGFAEVPGLRRKIRTRDSSPETTVSSGRIRRCLPTVQISSFDLLGGISMAKLVFRRPLGAGSGDVVFFALWIFDTQDQHVLGHPPSSRAMLKRCATRKFLAERALPP